MKRPRDLVLGSCLLALGLLPLLALRNSPENRAPSADAAALPAVTSAPATVGRAPCPRGQIDDFGVCVPIAQARLRSHSSPE